MEHKPDKETWFEFMGRAKHNGLSPTMQEEIDREKSNAKCSRAFCDEE
jgi:hypothetical protein